MNALNLVAENFFLLVLVVYKLKADNHFISCLLLKRSKTDISKQVCGRYPVLHSWEHSDPRLLVCEAFLLHNSSEQHSPNANHQDGPKGLMGPVSNVTLALIYLLLSSTYFCLLGRLNAWLLLYFSIRMSVS